MILAHANPAAHFVIVAIASVAAAAYLVAWMQTPNRSLARPACFVGGLTLAIIADTPPVEAAASSTFTAHMVQHLVLYIAVPLLVTLGRPTVLVPPRYKTHRGLRRLRPAAVVLSLAATVGVLYPLHLTSLYDRALDHPVIHVATHAALIGAGLLLWNLAMRPGNHDGHLRAGIALFTSVPIAALGVVLTTGEAPISSHYAAHLGRAQALADQHRGGALMWIGAMLAGAAITLVTIWRWASHEQRTQERIEHTRSALDEQVPVGCTHC